MRDDAIVSLSDGSAGNHGAIPANDNLTDSGQRCRAGPIHEFNRQSASQHKDTAMKASERKIKQGMPFEDIPAYLRRLADALEKKVDNLPTELTDLPEPIGKLELKGKAREGSWDVKIKIKAEPPPELAPDENDAIATVEDATEGKPQIKYKSLKKRMKASFKDIGDALEAQKLPEPVVLNAFLTESDIMMAFPGKKYGAPDYPAYRDACRQLADAYEDRNYAAFKDIYARLAQMKKDCHKAYK